VGAIRLPHVTIHTAERAQRRILLRIEMVRLLDDFHWLLNEIKNIHSRSAQRLEWGIYPCTANTRVGPHYRKLRWPHIYSGMFRPKIRVWPTKSSGA
jgi:hypothetical protein